MMNFNNDGYMTRGFNALPELVKAMIGSIINTKKEQENVDYLQVFNLSKVVQNGITFQKIVNEQEQPPLKRTYMFPFTDAVNEKVFCIDDEEYHTYMLSKEY